MYRTLKLLLSLTCITFTTAQLTALPLDYKEQGISLETIEDDRPFSINGETEYQLEELAVFQFGSGNGSDCWGWKALNGDQYAIMGISSGVVFVNVTTQQVIDTVPGSGCVWQDMKTYQNYCYAVSECGSGIRIIDMQYLPDSVHLVSVIPTSDLGTMSSHNAFIDTVAGYLYVEGTSGSQAIFIHDLSDPENPVYIGSFGPSLDDIHDMYIINDTAYVAAGSFPVFNIYDLADKLNPIKLVQAVIPNAGYVHNIWPTDDRQFVVTTEETSGKTVKVWYIGDYNDIRLIAEYLAPGNLAHNAHIDGQYLFLSHYSSGVRVLDLTNPFCLKEVAIADLPSDNCWGVYPHTGDSLVYSSHLDGRLFIYRFIEDPLFVSSETDSDSDGWDDDCDNCPAIANTLQQDADVDGIGDICDSCPDDPYNDSDGDGVCGDIDNCPNFNPDQADIDNDGIADACDICPNDPDNDIDSDGRCADVDNCPDVTNDLQLDDDNDGVGNACDDCPGDIINDPDEDGLCALSDNCRYTFNPAQTDSDSDGIGDACDNCPAIANSSQADTNSDGIGDACCCLGTRGNIDGDSSDMIDIADLVYIVNYSFGTPIGPSPNCPAEADLDASGDIDISDIVYMVDYMFGTPTGPAPLNCS